MICAEVYEIRLCSGHSLERPVLLHVLLFLGPSCRDEVTTELVLCLSPNVVGVSSLDNVWWALVGAAGARCADARRGVFPGEPL